MTFAEVEEVLGRPLPASARRHQAWWANAASHAHAGAWLDAGWRTARLDLAGERLTFVRDRALGVAEPGEAMRGLLVMTELLTPAARKLVEREAAHRGVSPAEAAAAVINEAALDRRRALIWRLAATAPRVDGDSVDLIREDRDGR